MKTAILFLSFSLCIFACGGGQEDGSATTSNQQTVGLTVDYTAPEPMEVPAAKKAGSSEDWEAMVHNKEIEVIQVINIINPVAVYITAGFEQYGSQIKSATIHEEWEDTQAQLTQAMTLYESCKKRKSAGKFDKQLFLDMEHTWQLLVKTGVAGVRTKQMLDEALNKLSS
jgi:hypothetical protein